MYKPGSRRIDTRRDPDSRAQIAKAFKATYASLGLSLDDAAKLLHVTPRTLHNWNSGRYDIPYAARKLLRVLLCYELPDKRWDGWHFSAGKLYTPEGYSIAPHESSWWGLLVRQAQGAGRLFRENQRLRAELAAALDAATPDGEDAHAASPAGGGASVLREGTRAAGLRGDARRLSGVEVPVTLQQMFTGEKKQPSKGVC